MPVRVNMQQALKEQDQLRLVRLTIVDGDGASTGQTVLVPSSLYQKFTAPPSQSIGGGRKAAKWCATKKTVKCRDGVTRTLHAHPGKPGDLRVRRMTVRGGRKVATYVKP